VCAIKGILQIKGYSVRFVSNYCRVNIIIESIRNVS